jgi:hypothetical protein
MNYPQIVLSTFESLWLLVVENSIINKRLQPLVEIHLGAFFRDLNLFRTFVTKISLMPARLWLVSEYSTIKGILGSVVDFWNTTKYIVSYRHFTKKFFQLINVPFY